MKKMHLFYKGVLALALVTANLLSFTPEAAKAAIMPNGQYLYFSEEENKKFERVLDAVSTNTVQQDEAPSQKVKIALIDSGVNYSVDIDVKERKNFIPDQNEIPTLYEDVSGHGTNIAGIIAAKDNGIGITGINPNVELYSAKVLDAGNTAPISRVIEGIEWAIEKKVNIINISFTTNTNSKELHDIIRKAYEKNILIIAAAGNEGYVAYPAAYPEVIAVGSVNSKGDTSQFSPSDKTVELVAPGELITASDVFDTVSTNSGTSYSAPYVTAVASLLWEKDLSCSNNFIRCILNCNANLYWNSEQYGYGLVDYEFASAIYELLKPLAKYNHALDVLMRYAIEIYGIYNPTKIPSIEAPDDLVEGAWNKVTNGSDSDYAHRNPFLGTMNTNEKSLILAGCVVTDVSKTGLSNMYLNPYFHGYMHYYPSGERSGDYTDANYIAGGLYLTYVAKAMMSNKEYSVSSIYVKSGDYNLAGLITKEMVNSYKNITWESIASQIRYYGHGSSATNLDTYAAQFDYNNPQHKALVIYGMAIHSLICLHTVRLSKLKVPKLY